MLGAASTALCDVATPTAEFKSIFLSAQHEAAEPTEGATVSSDAAQGVTDVSLYFTATAPQGPGRITGAATAATATALFTAPEVTVVVSALTATGSGARNAAAAGKTTGKTTAAGKATPTEVSADKSEASVVGGGLRAVFAVVVGLMVGLMA